MLSCLFVENTFVCLHKLNTIKSPDADGNEREALKNTKGLTFVKPSPTLPPPGEEK